MIVHAKIITQLEAFFHKLVLIPFCLICIKLFVGEGQHDVMRLWLEQSMRKLYRNFTEGELLQGIQAKIIFSQTNALGTFKK
jgi:hypothetical protein